MTSQVTILNKKKLQALIQGWEAPLWESRATQHRSTHGPIVLKDDAASFIEQQVRQQIESNQSDQAAIWTSVGIILSDGAILKTSKFTDALRPTTFAETHLSALLDVLNRLEDSTAKISGLETAHQRVSSFRNYAALYLSTRGDEANLLQRLHNSPDTSLATMLARVETAFADPSPRKSLPWAKTIQELDREEIASGVSYAVEAYNKRYGISPTQFRPFEETDPAPTAFDDDIVLAYRLRELIGLEASIYRQEYQCINSDTGEYRVSPPTERWGMALSLEYVRQTQAPFSAITNVPDYAQSFDMECQTYFNRLGDRTLALAGEAGRERLIFGLPSNAWRILSEHLFLNKKYYAEEVAELNFACAELLASGDELLSLELKPGLSMEDVIRIQRVFRFAGMVRMLALTSWEIPELAARNSVLGALKEKVLLDLLVTLGFSKEAAQAFLNLFSWDASLKEFLDIQYRPLLKIGDTYGVPFFVLGFSNAIRNGLLASKVRVHEDGANDPVAKVLADSFAEAGIPAETGVDYTFADYAGEVDVLAKVGGRIYAFECKHTLLPSSAFEQRTTWDYLETACGRQPRSAEI